MARKTTLIPGCFKRSQGVDVLKALAAHAEDQKRFADALGVSEQYLSDVLRGRRSADPLLKRAGFKEHVAFTPTRQVSDLVEKLIRLNFSEDPK